MQTVGHKYLICFLSTKGVKISESFNSHRNQPSYADGGS